MTTKAIRGRIVESGNLDALGGHSGLLIDVRKEDLRDFGDGNHAGLLVEVTQKSNVPASNGDNLPRIDVRAVGGGTYYGLVMALFDGDMPLPCWLVVGNSAHRVTRDNHRDFARGMVFSLEARAVLE